MSRIGNPAQLSAIQAANQPAPAARSRERAATPKAAARKAEDLLDLEVETTQAADAAKGLPQNASEQAEDERHREGRHTAPPPERPRIDVRG